MKGGKNRLPADLKLLRNNPGKRKIHGTTPQPGALSRTTPRELPDEVARTEWRRTVIPAIKTGQITAADRALAIAHCVLWSTWQSQTADATNAPSVLTTTGKHGGRVVPNPARTVAHRTLTLLLKVDLELGLSPSSRSRVTVTPPRPVNPLDRFLTPRRGE